MASLLLAIIYLCFISLGLPDSLLGSAWPVMQGELGVPVSYAGIISSVIFLTTILATLFTDRLLRKFGSYRVTLVSTVLTAAALFGFSVSDRFWMLILFAIPYGLGAGGVDAILNNYVALHYKPQHMSWLHCMWGVGASVSPYIMSFSLLRLNEWSYGYLAVSVIQALICIIILVSRPMWKSGIPSDTDGDSTAGHVSFKELFKIKGALPCLIIAFSYCSMELTTSLWLSTYLVEKWTFSPESAAGYASMFYIGITVGRFINGFLSMKLSDQKLIRMSLVIVSLGIAMLFLPSSTLTLVGFTVIGLGGSPIYPCLIHMIPDVFGKDKSQAMIGVQMAFSYVGFLIMPTLFGIVAEWTTVSILPFYQIIFLAIMIIMHEIVIKSTKKG